MSIEAITKQDLQILRQQILGDIKELFSANHGTNKNWLRSREVRKLLSISPGTLQSFRINGDLKPSKIGGIHFYRYSEIEKLLSEKTEVLNCKLQCDVGEL